MQTHTQKLEHEIQQSLAACQTQNERINAAVFIRQDINRLVKENQISQNQALGLLHKFNL